MKVYDAVARALRLIGVLDPRQPVQHVDMQTALVALNAMMNRLEANGMTFGWSDVDNPNDDLPIPLEAQEMVPANLALRLAPEYQVEVPPNVTGMAVKGMQEMQCDVKNASPLRFDTGRRGYDTRTDSWGGW